MSKSRFLQLIVFITALIFLGIGFFLYAQTHRNLYTAIFLRGGAIFFLFGCFWTQIQKLPRWTDIGWLPLIAVAISWKLFLLRFAIPTSIILVFLNSPLGRGKYRRKSWRKIGDAFMNPQTDSSPKKADAFSEYPEKSSVTGEESSNFSHSGNVSDENQTSDEISREESTDTANQNEGVRVEILENHDFRKMNEAEKQNPPKQTSPNSSSQENKRPREEKKNAKSDVRGPNAKNVMFRAMSRVAGRQVGKLMNQGKKK